MNEKDSIEIESIIRRRNLKMKSEIATNIVSIKKTRLANKQRRFTLFPSISIDKRKKGGKLQLKPKRRKYEELTSYLPYFPKQFKSLRKKKWELLKKSNCYRLLCVNKKTLGITEIQIVNTVVLKQDFKKLSCFIVSGSINVQRFIQGKSDYFLFVTKDFSFRLIEILNRCSSVNCRPISEHCFFTLLKKYNISQIKVNQLFYQQTKELYCKNCIYQLPLLIEIPLNKLRHQSFLDCPVIDINVLRNSLPTQKDNFFLSPTYNLLPTIGIENTILARLVYINTPSISVGTYNLENHSILAINGSFLSGTTGSLIINEKGSPVGLLENFNQYKEEFHDDYSLEHLLLHHSALKNRAFSFYSSNFLKLCEAFLNFMYNNKLETNHN